MAHKFTYEEDKIIIKNKNESYLYIADLSGLPYRSVIGRLKTLKYTTLLDLEEERTFIIENYKKMNVRDMAAVLNKGASYVYSRVNILADEGLINKKTTWVELHNNNSIPKKPNISTIDEENFQINPMPKKMKIVREKGLYSVDTLINSKFEKGKKYKVEEKSKLIFEGILEDETERNLVFRHKHGYKECFLKVSFIIGEYSLKVI